MERTRPTAVSLSTDERINLRIYAARYDADISALCRAAAREAAAGTLSIEITDADKTRRTARA